MLRLLRERSRGFQAPLEVLDVGLGGVADEPLAGHERDHLLQECTIDAGRKALVRLEDRASARQQHVLGDLRERARRLLGRPEPAVLQVEGRAVVDQPHLLVPDEQVRVAALRSTLVRRASNQTMSAASSASGCTGPLGVYASEPGRKSMPTLSPPLA